MKQTENACITFFYGRDAMHSNYNKLDRPVIDVKLISISEAVSSPVIPLGCTVLYFDTVPTILVFLH